MLSLSRLPLVVLFGVGLVCPAATLTVLPSVSGSYLYSYDVTPSGASETFFLFRLIGSGPLGILPGTVTAPTGWDVIELTNELIFTSTDPGFDLGDGTHGSFTFQSPLTPGVIDYEGSFADASGFVTGNQTGSLPGPTAVPEPSLTAVGALLLATWILRGRRRRAALAGYAGCFAITMLSAAPVAVVRIQGSPAAIPDESVRAGRVAAFDASASTGTGPLSFTWQQVSGPSVLRWISRTGPVASVLGTVFGEYRVRVTVTDSTGSQTADLVFGAVATDDQNAIVPVGGPNAQLLFTPMARYGASPWPLMDELHRGLADRLGGKTVTDPNWNGVDFSTPLTGTIQVAYNSAVIIGSGTRFQDELCGGAGSTTPVTLRQVVIWFPVSGEQGRRPYEIARCDSQTQLTLRGPYLTTAGTTAGLSYSYLTCGECWVNSSNNINYYDVVLALYGLHYRSGRTQYLTHARNLASRWWTQPYFDKTRTMFIGDDKGPKSLPPRSQALLGLMWWAYESQQAAVWPALYPLLDRHAAEVVMSGPLTELREQSYQLAYVAVAAQLAPDAAKRAEYLTAAQAAVTSRWLPQQTATGSWLIRTYGVSSWDGGTGTVTVTNGSDIITGNGTNWQPGFFNDTYLWIAWDANGHTGDTVAYYQPTFLSSTSLRLPRPYEGPTATGRFWTAANLPGWGVQPFIHGLAGRMLDLVYRVTKDAALKQAIIRAGNWLINVGIQPTARGLYYGRIYPPCEPAGINVRWCSYDPADPFESRGLSATVFGLLSVAYLYGGSPAIKTAADDLAGAAVGRFGGPLADTRTEISRLDTTLWTWVYPAGTPPYVSDRFKEFGQMFGAGLMASWPTARLK